jgi:prevent-host-death family protein
MLLKTVGSYEAKTHLPALLDAVSEGQQIVITRKGIPVAILSPYADINPEITTTIADLLSLRKKMYLGGLSIRDMKEEGRK